MISIDHLPAAAATWCFDDVTVLISYAMNTNSFPVCWTLTLTELNDNLVYGFNHAAGCIILSESLALYVFL